jgi:hypothetical protein
MSKPSAVGRHRPQPIEVRDGNLLAVGRPCWILDPARGRLGGGMGEREQQACRQHAEPWRQAVGLSTVGVDNFTA